jgi:prevent-host-death family protein
MIIKPASELRNNFTGISKIVREGETVFLTRNGSGDMVVMSQAQYNKQMAMLELYEKLSYGEEDVKAGRVKSSNDVFNETDKLFSKD